MKIVGVEGWTNDDVLREVDQGGKFVYFSYCISCLVLTFRRSSDIYFIPAGHNRVVKGLPFVAMSFFLGWWGIPWGPIYTIGSLVTNFGGGKDVTNEIVSSIVPKPPPFG